MTGSLTLDLWKVAIGSVMFAFGVAGLIVAVLRWYLGTLAKGQRTLFNITNEHTRQIAALEKLGIVIAPEKAAVFLAPTKPSDFDKTVVLEPKG